MKSPSPSPRKLNQKKIPGSRTRKKSLIKQATMQSFLHGSNDPTPRTAISNVLSEGMLIYIYIYMCVCV